jgi:hypothetical protein
MTLCQRGVCSAKDVSSLAGIASLVIATFDLKAVQSVRDAIRTADLSGAATVGKLLTDRYEPGRVFHPDDRYAPRRVIHPEPRYETGQVITEHPRLALQRPAEQSPDGQTTNCYCNTSGGKSSPTFEPPWHKVPWNEPMPARPIVKVIVHPPDIKRSGKLIDFYM